MLKQFMQQALQAGLPPSAIADRLIRVYGIDADSAKKLVAALIGGSAVTFSGGSNRKSSPDR